MTIDDRNEKIGRKIRDNELRRVPYMLVVGEKEAENGEVSVRKQGEGTVLWERNTEALMRRTISRYAPPSTMSAVNSVSPRRVCLCT